MKKANVAKVEQMAADFLQYRYGMYLIFQNEYGDKPNPDLLFYNGACDMIQSFGGQWIREFHGSKHSEEDLNNPKMYAHYVKFPDDKTCENLNLDAWK